MTPVIGLAVGWITSWSSQQGTVALFGYATFHYLPFTVLLTSFQYKCLIDCNADNNEPEDLIQQTFFGELQCVVQFNLPKSFKIHQLQDETVLLVHIRTYDAMESEDGFWDYSTLKPSPHFVDLKMVVYVVGRVHNRRRWTFIDRSGPTVHVEMASPPLSQCSDITDFSMSEESKSDSNPGSSLESSPMTNSSAANGIPMDLDTSSEGSSESL